MSTDDEEHQLIVVHQWVDDVVYKEINSTASDVWRDVTSRLQRLQWWRQWRRQWWRQWRVSIKPGTSSVIRGSVVDWHGCRALHCRVGGRAVCGSGWIPVRRSASHCGRRSVRPLNWEVISALAKTCNRTSSYYMPPHGDIRHCLLSVRLSLSVG